MKPLLGVLLAFALLLACSAVAVNLFADRALFVSPPDAVAEGFIREVMTKRWDRAREYLANPDSMTRAQLEELQSRLGEGENADAHTISRDAARAVVEVTVGTQTLRVALIWAEGWRVTESGMARQSI